LLYYTIPHTGKFRSVSDGTGKNSAPESVCERRPEAVRAELAFAPDAGSGMKKRDAAADFPVCRGISPVREPQFRSVRLFLQPHDICRFFNRRFPASAQP